jgi:predicted  nucleic acid-binding Zn-ribbon protein
MLPNPGTNSTDVEALDCEAREIEQEAQELRKEAREIEHLAEKIERRAEDLERDAKRLAHHPCPPIPAPRPVQPPRVHGFVAA